jgi:ABC-type transporter Mla MlaB component
MAGTASIIAEAKNLSHDAAEKLCDQILGSPQAKTVVLDLQRTEDADTAAFARLVVLRRNLLKDGRDLRLRGLKQRAKSLWTISKLASVLPVQ